MENPGKGNVQAYLRGLSSNYRLDTLNGSRFLHHTNWHLLDILLVQHDQSGQYFIRVNLYDWKNYTSGLLIISYLYWPSLSFRPHGGEYHLGTSSFLQSKYVQCRTIIRGDLVQGHLNPRVPYLYLYTAQWTLAPYCNNK